MLVPSVDINILAPLLVYMTKPISIKAFWKLLSCLPSFVNNLHNDHIIRAAHYLANTLGIILHEMPLSNLLDISMAVIKTKQMWRKATLLCRCPVFKACSFCISCSYLVRHRNVAHITRCPGCNNNDSSAHIGSPCLAYQFANLVFWNPLMIWITFDYLASCCFWIKQQFWR